MAQIGLRSLSEECFYKAVPLPTTESFRDYSKVWHDIEVAGKQCFVKRSLSPIESVQWSPITHKAEYPAAGLANRLRNEKGAIDFVRKNTKIPVPNILFYIDEGDRVWLCTEKVEGITFHDVTNKEDQAKVIQQLDAFTEELASHRSPEIKGFALSPSFHFCNRKYNDDTHPMLFKHNFKHGYPLCHGDLSRDNVIVDPKTMEVKAIIDWEYCGYYPPEVDAPRYKEEWYSVVYPDGTAIDYDEYPARAIQRLDELSIGLKDWLKEKKRNGDGEAAKKLDEMMARYERSWEETKKKVQSGKQSAPSAATAQTSGDAKAKE